MRGPVTQAVTTDGGLCHRRGRPKPALCRWPSLGCRKDDRAALAPTQCRLRGLCTLKPGPAARAPCQGLHLDSPYTCRAGCKHKATGPGHALHTMTHVGRQLPGPGFLRAPLPQQSLGGREVQSLCKAPGGQAAPAGRAASSASGAWCAPLLGPHSHLPVQRAWSCQGQS